MTRETDLQILKKAAPGVIPDETYEFMCDLTKLLEKNNVINS